MRATANNSTTGRETFSYNGQTFTMSATFQGYKNGVFGDNYTHPHFIIYVSTDSEKTHFSYYASYNDYKNGVNSLDRDGLKDALYCFLSDGVSYDDWCNFDEFCDVFGYNEIRQYKQARAIFDGCRRHHVAAVRLFGSDYCEILNELEQ